MNSVFLLSNLFLVSHEFFFTNANVFFKINNDTILYIKTPLTVTSFLSFAIYKRKK